MRTEEGPARVPGTQRSGARMQVRRRLVQGLFAVPAVVPLTGGAQTAQGSLLCSQKITDKGLVGTDASQFNLVFGAPATATQAWAVDVWKLGGDEVVKGSQIRNWATGMVTTSISDGVYKLRDMSLIRSNEAPAPSEDGLVLLDPRKYASVNLRPSGSGFVIVNVGTPTTPLQDQHIMWGSCWSSFRPGV